MDRNVHSCIVLNVAVVLFMRAGNNAKKPIIGGFPARADYNVAESLSCFESTIQHPRRNRRELLLVYGI
jgi:hypothetical protein